MFSRVERIIFALILALLAAGVTLVFAQAQESSPTLAPPDTAPLASLRPSLGNELQEGTPPLDVQSPDCTTCHTEFQMSWQSGPHGQAGKDPVFVAEWTAQGKPGACLVCHTTGYDPATATWEADSITCESCHANAPADHPKSPMPVDRSPDLCGRCHSDTRFGWQDWQGSTHYQRGMSCTTCHDPHSASLKLTSSRDGTGFKDASSLCINCHQEASMTFPYTPHSQEGVSCVDCHLEHMESQDRAAHTVPDHSFTASLQTCNTCHAQQMHNAAEAVSTGETSTPSLADASARIEAASVTPEPTPVSPMGYAGLAGLVGLAAGMVLAPWLEKFYRRVVKHAGEEKNG